MEILKCNKCGESKTVDEFAKDSGSFIGRSMICKSCTSKRGKELRRTRVGLAYHIYNSQRSSSKSRGMDFPNYSKDEFVLWLFTRPSFPEMYNNWVESGYNKQLTPSGDRLDDSKPYSFDNLRLLTWGYHNEITHQKRKLGIDNSSNKAIRQYDRDGNFIQEFFSIKEAHRITGISDGAISAVAKGKRKTAGGFIWKYATDSLNKVDGFKNDCIVKIYQFDMDGNFIQEHDSISDAARAVGLKSSSNITSVAKGNKKSVGGFIWKYA